MNLFYLELYYPAVPYYPMEYIFLWKLNFLSTSTERKRDLFLIIFGFCNTNLSFLDIHDEIYSENSSLV